MICILSILSCFMFQIGLSDVSSSEEDNGDHCSFVGTYKATLHGFPVRISVCQDNGRYYIASKRLTSTFEAANYINLVGRSTDKPESSDGDDEIIFTDSFRFTDESGEDGAVDISLTLRCNESEYTLSNGEHTDALTKTDDSAEVCVAPQRNWDIETAFYSESLDLVHLCPSDSCVEVQRFEVGGTSCWVYYDLKDNAIASGGDLDNNVEIAWDGGLRIIEWTDYSVAESAACSTGTEFQIWQDQESYLNSWKCRLTSAGGGSYVQFTQCARVCGELTDECPMFTDY